MVLAKCAHKTSKSNGSRRGQRSSKKLHNTLQAYFSRSFLWLFAIYDGGNHFWLFALHERLNGGPDSSAHHPKRRKMMERPSKSSRPPQSTQKREKIQFALEPFLCNNEMKHVEAAEMCEMRDEEWARWKSEETNSRSCSINHSSLNFAEGNKWAILLDERTLINYVSKLFAAKRWRRSSPLSSQFRKFKSI